MSLTSIEVADSGHDAPAWAAVFAHGLDLLCTRWGLERRSPHEPLARRCRPDGCASSVTEMEFRYLGNSGLKISEITYGNWLTHGSQVENDIATQCVNAALDNGITTFDTADAYANTAAESVLGDALAGQRRGSLEIFTKVYWPTGPKGPNDRGLSRKHILESIDGSLTRLKTDYVDLYQAHRYDYETPLEETMQAFADIVRQGKALYIGVSEWTAQQLRDGHALATELGFQLISNQPQYSMLWRVIEEEVVPASRELGISQIVWSPVAQGVLTGKYKPGAELPEGSRATDEKGGADMVKRFLRDDVLERVQKLTPVADDLGLTLAQLAIAWVLANDNVASAIIGASKPEQVESNVKAAGTSIPAEALARIDEIVGDLAERDPAKTVSPETRP
jgi:aryl-alcohol dehydrogenase-like predicted oxidoreductase